MTTLFISDLHLDDARPAIVTDFERFLAGPARAAEALYILGDLVEAWVGDDDDSTLATRIIRFARRISSGSMGRVASPRVGLS